MDAAQWRRILWVRACEEADPEGLFIPHATRRRATREALQQLGDAPVGEERDRALLAARAGWLWARIRDERPALAEAARGLARWSPPAWLFGVGGLGLGLGMDALGGDPAVSILAFPLLGLIAWNALAYAALAARALRRGAGRGLERVARWWVALELKLARLGRGEDAAWVVRATRSFTGLWADCAGGAELSLWRSRLHVGAAAVATGVVTGMYVAGLAFEYHASWESTFLDASGVQRLLAFVLGPASGWLGDPVPDVAGIAALETPASGDAAPWIHRWALTALAVIVAPRALLAVLASASAARRLERLAPDLGSPYFLRVLAAARGGGRTVRILPYSTEPSPAALARTRELCHELFGNGAVVDVEKPAPYGAETDECAGPENAATVILFSLAQSPELEVHGRFVEDWMHGDAQGPFLVLLDEEPYSRLSEPGRRDERFRNWQRVLAEAGGAAARLDPDGDADALLREAREALHPGRREAGA